MDMQWNSNEKINADKSISIITNQAQKTKFMCTRRSKDE